MIKNIIFDVGKVLVSYEPVEMLKSLGFDDTIVSKVNEALFEDEIWELSDGGQLSPDELLERAISNAPGYADEVRLAWEHVGDTIELLPYAMDWIKSYKDKGYKVYILSNYAEHTLNLTRHKLKFLPIMDGVVFSYACKMMKPDAQIYEHIISEFGLIPEECIFVDDREDNVQGAIACGINAVVFKNFEDARDKMADMF